MTEASAQHAAAEPAAHGLMSFFGAAVGAAANALNRRLSLSPNEYNDVELESLYGSRGQKRAQVFSQPDEPAEFDVHAEAHAVGKWTRGQEPKGGLVHPISTPNDITLSPEYLQAKAEFDAWFGTWDENRAELQPDPSDMRQSVLKSK